VLIAKSKAGNSSTAPSSAIGIPAATQNATRKRRMSASTAKTNPRPHRALRQSVPTRARRLSDSSFQMVSSMPSGICRRARSTWALTTSATSRMSSSPTRKTLMITAGCPSK
jgi:hypothetical protein